MNVLGCVSRKTPSNRNEFLAFELDSMPKKSIIIAVILHVAVLEIFLRLVTEGIGKETEAHITLLALLSASDISRHACMRHKVICAYARELAETVFLEGT